MRWIQSVCLFGFCVCAASCAASPSRPPTEQRAATTPERAEEVAAEPQSAPCKKLVACMTAVMPEPGASKQYEPDGSCWKSGEEAERCTKACEVALDGLKSDAKFAENAACK